MKKCICSELWKRLKGFPWCLTSCRDCWSCNFCPVNVHFLWLFMKQELHLAAFQWFQALVHFTALFVSQLSTSDCQCAHFSSTTWERWLKETPKYLLLFPGACWQSLICISEFSVRHTEVVDYLLLPAFGMPTPHTTHMLYSCLSLWKQAFHSVTEISWQGMALVCTGITFVLQEHCSL